MHEIEKKLDLLTKPFWSNRDIQEYFEVSPKKAIEMKRAKGVRTSPYQPTKIVADTLLLSLIGKTREEEAKIYSNIKLGTNKRKSFAQQYENNK